MRSQKTYFLDLQTLLMYLSTQSCELSTEVKVSGKNARGSIVLQEGKIVSCLFTYPDGFQILGEQAYKQIEACTEWQVELRQPEEKKKKFSSGSLPVYHATGPLLPQARNIPPPPLRPKRPLNMVFLQNLLPRERLILRSVYAMINGKRSKEEIKAQLHLPSDEVDAALNRLQAFDLIE